MKAPAPEAVASTWVERVGGIIIARIRGVPTEALLRECQRRGRGF